MEASPMQQNKYYQEWPRNFNAKLEIYLQQFDPDAIVKEERTSENPTTTEILDLLKQNLKEMA